MISARGRQKVFKQSRRNTKVKTHVQEEGERRLDQRVRRQKPVRKRRTDVADVARDAFVGSQQRKGETDEASVAAAARQKFDGRREKQNRHSLNKKMFDN